MNANIEIDTSLRALWRWKWIVLLGALVAAAATAAVTLAAPAKYTTSTLVQVGRVMGDEVEDPYAIAQTVNSPGFQEAMRTREAGGKKARGSVTAEAVTGGQGRAQHPVLVRVTAIGPTPEDAVAVGQAAVDELVARHKERFDKAVAGYRDYEKVLGTTGEPAAGPADPAARKELFELRAKLASPVFTEETHAKDAFPVPTAPVPKNTLLLSALAFAVALAVLVLLAVAVAQVAAPRPE